jgi:hypothetical protein
MLDPNWHGIHSLCGAVVLVVSTSHVVSCRKLIDANVAVFPFLSAADCLLVCVCVCDMRAGMMIRLGTPVEATKLRSVGGALRDKHWCELTSATTNSSAYQLNDHSALIPTNGLICADMY